MSFSTLSGLKAAMQHGQRLYFSRSGMSIPFQVGFFVDLWSSTTAIPSNGVIPATGNGEIPTKATAGSLPFNNPAGGAALYLAQAQVSIWDISAVTDRYSLFVVDRLWHNSGLAMNITTLQSFTSLALTRPDSTGTDVEMWLVFWVGGGGTLTTVTITYTNSAGTGSRTSTVVVPGSTAGNNTVFCTLQAGDTGVQSVQSVQMTPSTGGAGNMGVILARRICEFPLASLFNVNGLEKFDAFDLGLPKIDNNACLSGFISDGVQMSNCAMQLVLLLAEG